DSTEGSTISSRQATDYRCALHTIFLRSLPHFFGSWLAFAPYLTFKRQKLALYLLKTTAND
ncbi:MAG: hypothetical protein K2X77_14200, partial [Candidatus Obscuribacterales bacterium]|nr:hypothetical protein [Candidatus Obscuribacterales bacterium]